MTYLTSAGKPKKNRRPRTAAPIVAWNAQQAFQDKERPDRGGLIAFQSSSREEVMEEGRKFEESAGRSFC
jgi:hypothetical protein